MRNHDEPPVNTFVNGDGEYLYVDEQGDTRLGDRRLTVKERAALLGVDMAEGRVLTWTARIAASTVLVSGGVVIGLYSEEVRNFAGAGSTARPAGIPAASPKQEAQADPSDQTTIKLGTNQDTASPTTSPSPSPSPSPTESANDPLSCVASLPLNVRVAQGLMLATDGVNAQKLAADVENAKLGGVLIVNPETTAEKPSSAPLQLTMLTDGQTIKPFVATNQNFPVGEPVLPKTEEMSQKTPEEVTQLYSQYYIRLAQLGINVVAQPDAIEQSSPSSGETTAPESTTPEAVEARAKLADEAARQAGMLATYTQVDSGTTTTPPLPELETYKLMLPTTSGEVSEVNMFVATDAKARPLRLVRRATEATRRAITTGSLDENALNESQLRILSAKGVDACALAATLKPAQ